jgi:hypothetical protein
MVSFATWLIYHDHTIKTDRILNRDERKLYARKYLAACMDYESSSPEIKCAPK